MTRRHLLQTVLPGIPLVSLCAAFPARGGLSPAASDHTSLLTQTNTSMLLIRDVFQCKPGTARQVAEMFKRAIPSMEQEDGFRNCRVMVDYVASYWTVVLQAEVDEIDQFDHHMATFSKRPEVREALSGYLEMVESGHREIYRIL